MPAYILLCNYSADSLKSMAGQASHIKRFREGLERWEAKILHEYTLMGSHDHLVVFEVSDNVRAQQAVLQQDFCTTEDSQLLAAIDLPLFERMLQAEIRTEGPHRWQVSWWARSIRVMFRWHYHSRWIWKYCKPFTVTGRENFNGVKSPCIVVANHVSHMDAIILFSSLPQRIKSNIYFGAAADRWFLRKGGGKKALALQPWYNSLIGGNFPLTRGGGSRALDYSKWLLDQGANLAIFPEGTRSTSRHMAKFKHGVALLATEKQVPILPVYLAGTAALRPKGQREVTPGPVSAHIQEPIYLPQGIAIPDATRMIYESLNAAHLRVKEAGADAGHYQYVTA
ncbi:MAG: 1-acyl-sn-glycerol-3-phosphate acyltransferase [Pseudomonadales bacterium]